MQKSRHILFLVIASALVSIFWKPLLALASLSWQRAEYSHIVSIPLISMFLIYWRRAEVFVRSASNCYAGLALLLAGLGSYFVAGHVSAPPSQEVASSFSASIIGFVVGLSGAFLLAYGRLAFRAAVFSLGFLFFTVPIPSVLLTRIIHTLQEGSSDVTAVILRIIGVPFLQQGLIFRLPSITIQVAEECSGIRSGIALLITTLLAAQLFLRSNWRKLVLCALVVPIAMLKNGLRIATLSTLAVYVNQNFLYGRLHRSGGFIFFFIGLVVLCGALRLLQLGEPPKLNSVIPVPLGQPTGKVEVRSL